MECDLVGVLRFFFRCLLSRRPSGTEGSFFKSHPTPSLPLHLPLHFHNFYRRCPHYLARTHKTRDCRLQACRRSAVFLSRGNFRKGRMRSLEVGTPTTSPHSNNVEIEAKCRRLPFYEKHLHVIARTLGHPTVNLSGPTRICHIVAHLLSQMI